MNGPRNKCTALTCVAIWSVANGTEGFSNIPNINKWTETPLHKKNNTFNTKFVEYGSDVAMNNTFTQHFSEGCLRRQTLSGFSFNRLPSSTFYIPFGREKKENVRPNKPSRAETITAKRSFFTWIVLGKKTKAITLEICQFNDTTTHRQHGMWG